MQIICDLDRKCAEHQYGALSPWWQRLRETLLEESSVFKSLLAAILCRDLSVLYRQNEVSSAFFDYPNEFSNLFDDFVIFFLQKSCRMLLKFQNLFNISQIFLILSGL